MLEFQEGFFDQEVRDGFYIDTTMKTLWAAELEVLQKVAEVCDRHELKWYAAYGTLLGAIRHEGFVPWDDDMDIWVKRPDYNILMQVLPKELPEGYLVRGPLTDEGYDQFHTCLNNGNGISIAKEWLVQYHGCPFTVGLDIFPLDYLPRNEKDRDLQVQLLAMTGRIAQLAKNVARGDYNPKDGDTEQKSKKFAKKNKKGRKKKVKTQKEEVIEEINLGISYLEKNCNLQIDHQFLKDEDWYRVSSELWKWANYLAMMYGEGESDYLVEFFDYIKYPHKMYLKEWFADEYSATFENFMIPIPAGYNEILQYIYGLGGNYFVRIKKSGTHEYPFYARQLRQLREYVKNIQHRAQDVGLVSVNDITVREETKELPQQWKPLAFQKNGSRKKMVLSANDPAVYVAYGNKALDKLEEMFCSFERVKDSILLWWRPQPVMKKILDQVSIELGERYWKILTHYKEAGWGICDETDNIDRAVEACDIYYGDMNAIIQPFQNLRKPVMLSVVQKGEEWKANADRLNEYRTFLSMSDFAEDGERIYFANTNYNALVVANKATGQIVQSEPLIGYQLDTPNMHLQCVHLQDKIYFLPAGAQCVHIYNVKNGEQKVCRFLSQEDEAAGLKDLWDCSLPNNYLWGYFLQDNCIYLLPCYSRQGLWKLDGRNDNILRKNWWDVPYDDTFPLRHGTIDEDCFYTYMVHTNILYITNVSEQTVESFQLPDENVQRVTYDGHNFWYTIKAASTIVCWNSEQGEVDRYQVEYDPYYIVSSSYVMGTYQDIYYAGGHIFLFSGDGRFLYVLDQENRKLCTLHTIECARGSFLATEMQPVFKCIGETLICILKNTSEMLIIDLKTLDVRQQREVFHADSPIKEAIYEQSYKLLLDRSALLYEDNDIVNLDLLIRYCMNHS